MNKPELLAPAGSFEKAKTAFLYGADAVYMGTGTLSLRSRVDVEDDDLYKTVEYAHSINKKVYAALNIYARDEQYDEVREQARRLSDLKVDGIIVSDGGVLDIVKEEAPDVDIHISTQADVVSYHTCNFWYKNGARRIILARELNKEETKNIMGSKPKDLEIEMFVHGALCYAYSGRCHLSDFLSNRCANLGDCVQSCRWEYNVYLEETNNPGNLMPVQQDEKGTYIMSSKDLCLINELPEIINMGIESLKIEGRLKTEYYLAAVISAYRAAIDDYIENPNEYDSRKYLAELDKITTRSLTTLYFNDRNNKETQEYDGKQYSVYGEFGGLIMYECRNVGMYNEGIACGDNFKYVVEIRNKLIVGDTMELLVPNQLEPVTFTIDKLWDFDTDEEISCVNPGKEGQKVKLCIPYECESGWILRRKK